MQLKKSAVVGVLIMLCLSTDSCCHYIPEKKANATTPTTGKKNEMAPSSRKIQICGNALTNWVIEACGGNLGSFEQAASTRSSIQPKITEECCHRKCSNDYLQSYCGKATLFTTKKPLRGKLLGKSPRNQPRSAGGAAVEGKRKGGLEGSNGVNRTWPSIEIGTISPEIEKFGGQPIIVVRKNKSNSS